jgi:hypothetical protein
LAVTAVTIAGKRSVGPWLVALAMVLLVAGAFEPFYLRVWRLDAAATRQSLTELPYRKLPGFRRFVTDVDARTPAAARIALWMPLQQWEGGYGYGFYRAAFLAPSKTLVPMLTVGADRLAPEQLASGDYVAAWHGDPQLPGFAPVWRSPDGVLLRRLR